MRTLLHRYVASLLGAPQVTTVASAHPECTLWQRYWASLTNAMPSWKSVDGRHLQPSQFSARYEETGVPAVDKVQVKGEAGSQNSTFPGRRNVRSWAPVLAACGSVLVVMVTVTYVLLSHSPGMMLTSWRTTPRGVAPTPIPASTSAAKVILRSPEGSRGVRSVAFSFDYTYLAVADGNGTTYVWILPADKLAFTLADPLSRGVNAVAFSPDDAILAAGDGNGHIYLWAGTHYETLTDPASRGVKAVAFSSDNNYLAAADANGHTFIWDLATHNIVADLSEPGGGGIRSVAFSSNDEYLATADGNGSSYVWTASHDEPTATLSDPTSKGVNAVAFSPDNAILAAGDGNGHVYLWDHRLARQLVDPASKGVTAVAFAPNGEYLAVADANGHTFIWNLVTHRIVTDLSHHGSGGVRSVAFTPNGAFIAIGDSNGNTYISPLGA
jgi:WD40 repeat protein